MNKNPNDLLESAKEEIKNLDKGDKFVVKDLFKGYEWNKMIKHILDNSLI